ncbi:MAG: tetratricopeptide repeat protein [Opitutales bacterium]
MRLRLLLSPRDKAKLTRGLRICRTYKDTRRQSERVFEINPLRLFVLLAVLAVTTYVTASIVLYVRESRKPNNQITYLDIALPFRWPDLAYKRGLARIETGMQRLENQEFRSAIHLLRAGLRRVPEDLEARFTLAQLYAGARLVDQAYALLRGGLEFGYPEEDGYIPMLIATGRESAEPEAFAQTLLDLAEEAISQNDQEAHETLIQSVVQAYFQAEQYAAVLELVDAEIAAGRDNRSIVGSGILALLGQDRLAAADQRLEAFETRYPETIAPLMLRLRISMLREDGAAFDAAADTYFRAHSRTTPQIRNFFLMALQLGPQERVDRWVDRYLSLPLLDNQAWQSLAAFFSDIGYADGVGRIRNAALIRRPAQVPSLNFLYAQALVTEGRWEEARAAVDTYRASLGLSDPRRSGVAWLEALLNAVSSGGGDATVALIGALEDSGLPADAYRQSAEALLRAGRITPAEQVIAHTREQLPNYAGIERAESWLNEALAEGERTRTEASAGKISDRLRTEASEETRRMLEEEMLGTRTRSKGGEGEPVIDLKLEDFEDDPQATGP